MPPPRQGENSWRQTALRTGFFYRIRRLFIAGCLYQPAGPLSEENQLIVNAATDELAALTGGLGKVNGVFGQISAK